MWFFYNTRNKHVPGLGWYSVVMERQNASRTRPADVMEKHTFWWIRYLGMIFPADVDVSGDWRLDVVSCSSVLELRRWMHMKDRRPRRPWRTEEYCSWTELWGFSGPGTRKSCVLKSECNWQVDCDAFTEHNLHNHHPLANKSYLLETGWFCISFFKCQHALEVFLIKTLWLEWNHVLSSEETKSSLVPVEVECDLCPCGVKLIGK